MKFLAVVKSGRNATFNVIFHGLGWPWVGEFVGFIILFTYFPTQQNLVNRKHPIVINHCDPFIVINHYAQPLCSTTVINHCDQPMWSTNVINRFERLPRETRARWLRKSPIRTPPKRQGASDSSLPQRRASGQSGPPLKNKRPLCCARFT